MKALLTTILLLTLTTQAFAGSLLTIVYVPGFEINPRRYDVTLDTDNLLSYIVKPGTGDVAELANVAPATVEKISALIEATDFGQELVDLNEGEPFCTDTPTISVYLTKDSETKLIYQRHSCHEFRLRRNTHLYKITRIADGFLSMARL